MRIRLNKEQNKIKVMEYCCDDMYDAIDGDDIEYSIEDLTFELYGVKMKFCPFCGAELYIG